MLEVPNCIAPDTINVFPSLNEAAVFLTKSLLCDLPDARLNLSTLYASMAAAGPDDARQLGQSWS